MKDCSKIKAGMRILVKLGRNNWRVCEVNTGCVDNTLVSVIIDGKTVDLPLKACFVVNNVPESKLGKKLSQAEAIGLMQGESRSCTVVHDTENLSDFISHSTKVDKLNVLCRESTSSTEELPHLAFLRVELTRMRPGMGDFLFRISSPPPNPASKATVITLRGDRTFGRPEGVLAAAKVVVRELIRRKDITHDWRSCSPEYIASMLLGPCKFFVTTLGVDTLRFTTDAVK